MIIGVREFGVFLVRPVNQTLDNHSYILYFKNSEFYVSEVLFIDEIYQIMDDWDIHYFISISKFSDIKRLCLARTYKIDSVAKEQFISKIKHQVVSNKYIVDYSNDHLSIDSLEISIDIEKLLSSRRVYPDYNCHTFVNSLAKNIIKPFSEIRYLKSRYGLTISENNSSFNHVIRKEMKDFIGNYFKLDISKENMKYNSMSSLVCVSEGQESEYFRKYIDDVSFNRNKKFINDFTSCINKKLGREETYTLNKIISKLKQVKVSQGKSDIYTYSQRTKYFSKLADEKYI